MSDRPTPNKWARLDFPPEFRVGVQRFANDANWRLRETEGATWVATEERFQGTRPQLLRLIKIASARDAGRTDEYGRFSRWPAQDLHGSDDMRAMVAELPEVNDPQDNVDALVAFRLQFMTLPDEQVEPYLRDLFPLVASTTPDATLWAIEIHPSFRWRVAAVRALFSATETPEVLQRSATGEDIRFFSSQGLADPWNWGLNVFIEPVLLAASPWIAGISSVRLGGTALMLFGRSMAGFGPGQAVEALDLFRTSGLTRGRVGVTRPEHAASSYEAALMWWVGKVNDLVGMALDVGRFSDETGRYKPAAHLGVL